MLEVKMPKLKLNIVCDHCDAVFTRMQDYEEHKNSVNEEKSHDCETVNILGLESHSKSREKGEKPYKCDQCDKRFSSTAGFNYHKLTHSGEQPFSCDTCGRRFRHKSHLQNHIVKHTGERSHQCEICGLAFFTQKEMKCHQKVHAPSDKKPGLKEKLSLPCEVCGKIYHSHLGFSTHLKQHAGEKPFTCEICGKAYTNSAGLLYHQKTHSGEKGFTCDTCGRAFSSMGGLEIHKRTHTGEKPFHCDVCQLSFSSRSNLHAHQRTHTRAWLAAQHQVVPKPVSASALKMRKYREKLRADPSLVPPSLQGKPKWRPKKAETLKRYRQKLKALDKLRTLPMNQEYDNERLVYSVLELNGHSATDDNVDAASQQILELLPHNLVAVSSQQEQEAQLTVASPGTNTVLVETPPATVMSKAERVEPLGIETKRDLLSWDDSAVNHQGTSTGIFKVTMPMAQSSILGSSHHEMSGLKSGPLLQHRFVPQDHQNPIQQEQGELNYVTYEMLIESPEPILGETHRRLLIRQLKPSVPLSTTQELMPVDPRSLRTETQTEQYGGQNLTFF